MPLIKSDSDSDSQGIDSLLKRYVNGDARKHALRGSQGLKTGTLPKSSVNATHLLTHVKWLLRIAVTAQGCLLTTQVKTASAQVWKRKWHLVRSFFADGYCAISFDFCFVPR
jgi:hypothetical protein